VTEPVQVGTVDGVTTIRLNRPGTLNAITQDMARELRATLQQLSADDATRAVILTGNGRGFCAGADLGDIFGQMAAQAGDFSAARALEYVRADSVPLAQALLGFDKPLVAAVNGPCAGAGMGLALAADVIVAAEEAAFTVVFTRRGLVPDYGVTWLLPRLIGLRKARELCLLADPVPAPEALAMGLVTEVVPGDELLDAAGRWARRFAEGPAGALRLTKRLLAETFELDAHQAIEREFASQALCLTSPDAIEGVSAFLQKRPPKFSGA
jgi:2-(1,2-epoxy-1,2-dihydrophenyl)acetyl-CoA isomerase